MVFLLNQERVFSEILELTRLRIARMLGVQPDDVSAELEFADGRFRPKFQIEAGKCGLLDPRFTQKCMADIWLDVVKPKLVVRLAGLNEVRLGCEKTKKTSTEA